LEGGKTAINYGADAVYIGAEKFGARSAVGNSISDIEQLVSYGHKYSAKTYVTLNTILYDNELEDARKLIDQIYYAGADALIIQDMGLLEMDLPPIPLFASTQTNNYTPEKVKFLEDVGFERVILAREVSLQQIKEIRSKTNVDLEAFVHGALCVSLSGQCFFSHAVCGRSSNRGECSQPCRMKYGLKDSKGNLISGNKHLLSLKDMNQGDNIKNLIDAGVSSFKIEGRLKDINYIKNVTSYYRQKIDEAIDGSSGFTKASAGKTSISFIPDPEKTFNRGYTDYFLNDRNKEIASFNTPKSLGKSVGKVKTMTEKYFTLDSDVEIINGDGLCFFNKRRQLDGINVSRVEKGRIYPPDIRAISEGMEIFRNHDHEFVKTLKQDQSVRRISVDMLFQETDSGYKLVITDEEGASVEVAREAEKIDAQNPEKAKDNILKQLGKLGSTIFSVDKIDVKTSEARFVPIGLLNEMRRDIVELLEQKRTETYQRKESGITPNEVKYPEKELDHHGNVANRLAKGFYTRHGVESIKPAFELEKDHKGKVIMTTRHCLKHQFGMCARYGVIREASRKYSEPLYLFDNNRNYLLEFDCANCMMKIVFQE